MLGDGLRSVSGLIADKTHKYWIVAFVGYAVNMLAVPELALAGNWPIAAALIIAERTGRAIRRPSVEAMIPYVITAVLSNDATALILTPVVYVLVTRLRLSPLPFCLPATFIADTASFLLPVSNPINIFVINAFVGGLGTFLRFLLLPGLFCIGLKGAL